MLEEREAELVRGATRRGDERFRIALASGIAREREKAIEPVVREPYDPAGAGDRAAERIGRRARGREEPVIQTRSRLVPLELLVIENDPETGVARGSGGGRQELGGDDAWQARRVEYRRGG